MNFSRFSLLLLSVSLMSCSFKNSKVNSAASVQQFDVNQNRWVAVQAVTATPSDPNPIRSESNVVEKDEGWLKKSGSILKTPMKWIPGRGN